MTFRWELINLRNDRQHYQEGLFVYDIPTFNERVVREVVLNAASHRNHQLSGSVFIQQYLEALATSDLRNCSKSCLGIAAIKFKC